MSVKLILEDPQQVGDRLVNLQQGLIEKLNESGVDNINKKKILTAMILTILKAF